MKQRLTLFFVSMFLFVGAALAQTKVTGTVLSQEDGQPIIGAAVKVVGTSNFCLCQRSSYKQEQADEKQR